MPERRIHIGIIYLYSNLNNPVTYFQWKILALAGFEPGTSPVPSRYATNWAILAWIPSVSLPTFHLTSGSPPSLWDLNKINKAGWSHLFLFVLPPATVLSCIWLSHSIVFLPVEHRTCNRAGVPPTPLKSIWKFFAKLVLLRKHVVEHEKLETLRPAIFDNRFGGAEGAAPFKA